MKINFTLPGPKENREGPSKLIEFEHYFNFWRTNMPTISCTQKRE